MSLPRGNLPKDTRDPITRHRQFTLPSRVTEDGHYHPLSPAARQGKRKHYLTDPLFPLRKAIFCVQLRALNDLFPSQSCRLDLPAPCNDILGSCGLKYPMKVLYHSSMTRGTHMQPNLGRTSPQ